MRPHHRLGLNSLGRATAALAVAAVSGGLLVASTSAIASPTPPPNPSAGKISAAQARKNALGAEVGRLSGQVAAAQSQLQALQGRAEAAEQQVAFAMTKELAARAAEQRAKTQVTKAALTVASAHTAFVRYFQASYMTGSTDPSTGALLTAKDPTTLLQQTTLERYEAENKVDAIGQLQTATVAKSNADAQARRTTLRAKRAAAYARQQKERADTAVTAELTQKAALQQTLSSSQTQLTSAQSTLATLNHQHVQFVAYQAHQAELRRERLERLRRQREEARRQAEARKRQQERERQRQRQQQGGSSGGSGGSGGGGSTSGGGGGGGPVPPPSSNNGQWTPAKGREAASRAHYWLGEPYSWAGGGASGPSYGVCDPSNGAPNDCHVKGFDCSGLAMYAWGPYLSMDHSARLQYNEAGGEHPSISDLRPGDLIFYSYNGAVSGIHHVAIYYGDGEIIQAPYSGAYVEVSSMYDPGPIFGVTRPLTP